jgi:hypothetical protein
MKNNNKFNVESTYINHHGTSQKTYKLKYKDEVYDKYKDKLPYDLWNMDYKVNKNGTLEKTNGHMRVHRFAKKITAWEEHYGNTSPRGCEAAGCDVVGPISYYAFNRDRQKDDEGGYYLIYNTGEVIKTNGNPRRKNYTGPEISWLEFDHIDAKNKKSEMSQIIQKGSISRIVKEMKVCQLLCLKHHRAKTERESRAYGGKTKLPYLEAVNLIKNYIKPKSEDHFNPGKWRNCVDKYGIGALNEAIEKAKNTDPALYEDLKRIPRRPDEAYKKEGFKWSDITGNKSTKNRKKKEGYKNG